jgi:hypothetical protein
VKILTIKTLDQGGVDCYLSDLSEDIVYAVDRGVKIIIRAPVFSFIDFPHFL